MKRFTRKQAVMARERFLNAIFRGKSELTSTALFDRILSCEPVGSSGAYAFKWAYLKEEILTKFCDDSTNPDIRATKAVEKMLASEVVCKQMNDHGFHNFENKESIIFTASGIISSVLGDIDALFNKFDTHCHFTSGATACRTKRYGDPYYKYDSSRSLKVTSSALPYAKYIIDSTPLWGEQKIITCDGNVVFTVPKTSEIDRAACKEPALNQLLQTTVGDHIRDRLKLFGINLNDQSRNQKLAREGSLSGHLATIDLKSASDSISQRCVFELLPTCWVKLLDDLRSPKGLLPDGSDVVWEKHSTMGNGYTFELESLIFWALTCATIKNENRVDATSVRYRATHVSVYGDDIICPSSHYHAVCQTLIGVGFTVNEKKSFHEGPFRESCGGHYYNGHDVKPFYIRKPIDSPDRIIWLLNALRRWASDDDGWCDPSVYQLWLQLRRQFCPPEFLGGQDLASVSEVVSPENPRFSLRWVTPTKKINGTRAILRWFQYNPEHEALDSFRFRYSRESVTYSETSNPYASRPVVWDRITDIGSKERLRVKRYAPSLIDTAIFPQEVPSSVNNDLLDIDCNNKLKVLSATRQFESLIQVSYYTNLYGGGSHVL